MKKAIEKKPGEALPQKDRSEITSLFLKEDQEIPEELSHVYNLSGEFSRSKKNKSFPVYVAIALFSALLFASTYVLTMGIQRDIDKISVDISDFKDLNLSELLNELKKAEQEIGSINDRIAFEKRALEMEIEKINKESELELRRIERRSDLSDAQKSEQRRRIEKDRDQKIAAARTRYEDRIKESERQIQLAQSRRDELKQKTDVESKGLAKLLPSNIIQDGVAARLFGKDDAGDDDNRNKLAEQKREYETIIKKYESDLEQAREEAKKEVDKVRDTEDLLNTYRRALTYYARTRGEHGYVIDPGSGGNMLLDVNPYITIKKGDQAYIINRDDKVAALVELEPAGNRIRARVLRWMSSGAIHPFDKILLITN